MDAEDGVLGGGLPQGMVIGISSDLSSGEGRILALRLLIRDLLLFSNRHKRAMIIDSTGSFPLPTLLEVLKGCVGDINDGSTKTERGDRMPWREKVMVEGLLERIGITRVFDLEGVWDVIREVRAGRDKEEIEEEEEEEEESLRGKEEEETKTFGQGEGKEWPSRRDEGAGDDRWTKRAEEILRGGVEKQGGEREKIVTGLDERVTRPDEVAIEGKPAHRDVLEGETRSSQDTQRAERTGTPPPLPVPEKAAESTSSPLSPPRSDLKEPETSSPLSSLPDSPSPPHSASSSSLRSELVIEPSPVKERTNTVLSQAYQGLSLPPSGISEEEEEAAAISRSPFPPSSPPFKPSHAPTFAPPTSGFETHMSEAAQRQHKDSDTNSDTDTDSSSDTSSYLRGEHPSPSLNKAPSPAASQWQDAKSAPPPSMLLIDSLPPLLTQLFGTGTSDRTSAHKELAQLSRVLTQMSRSTINPLMVILLNSTTVPSAAKSLDKHLMRSVFADSKAIPSFGAVYDGMIDLSLLVSKVPRRQEDAEALYGGYGEHCSYTNVVECLRDDTPDLQRWVEEEGDSVREKAGERMNREGRWGSFDVFKVDGEVVMRDLDLGRKLGRYQEVGFGRRP